ncbi:ABC transporter ATP-binding protein [Desulfosporosinus meridiei]|uniref:ABC-type antimicrobial peptide transport system, ATPase component n=1 Tax=Desulfosporosinus meridiei (strain ATCC BAA-275 / DSM 13257 / KCTC 12902 / NCIMB 13706 / S10) TaxID=768704 RepID=J7IW39_DESMD|nr:ABC transporter ATP-binding protein [Desulfosporosinus meridiei]AFQ45960.1 ABC-type antimicrobial peptide transport system, ATPase component [Desulfosporosinus meridiei DSM 13257]
MPNVIELINVNKIFGTRVKTQILYDINLEIKEHSINSIVGASGSGKTTLLNIMGTLDRPTSGEVIIDGSDTKTMEQHKLAKLRNQSIGFIFQFHFLLQEFNVFDNVLLPSAIQRNNGSEIKERANRLLDMLGLYKYRCSNVLDLSGGQQQRVAIARSLINNPKVILADEPTGNLDLHSSEDVYGIFKQVNKEYGVAFVIVTHDKHPAGRVIKIQDRKLV